MPNHLDAAWNGLFHCFPVEDFEPWLRKRALHTNPDAFCAQQLSPCSEHCVLVYCAACTTNATQSPQVMCDLGATTTWSAGDTVQVTVPVVAGPGSATNAINTAFVTDSLNRTTNDTHPVTITQDDTVSKAELGSVHQQCHNKWPRPRNIGQLPLLLPTPC